MTSGQGSWAKNNGAGQLGQDRRDRTGETVQARQYRTARGNRQERKHRIEWPEHDSRDRARVTVIGHTYMAGQSGYGIWDRTTGTGPLRKDSCDRSI
jgi:hypothetical protein